MQKVEIDNVAWAYMAAKRFVVEAGFAPEIDWQDSLAFDEITEQAFLAEAAWVILSSGMREAVVRRRYPEVSEAFCNWASAEAILNREDCCRKQALACFNHEAKISAIVEVAAHVKQKGFPRVKEGMLDFGVNYLQQLPYIGPVTAYHLAKNVGLRVAKPDRHLTRIAERLGYVSPHELCDAIACTVGENVAVVDLVIWRFATLHTQYVDFFASGGQTALPKTDGLGAAHGC